MKKQILFAVAIILAIAGCKIDQSGLPQLQTNALLVNKWYVKAVTTITPAMGIYPQMISTVPDTSTKDYYQFNRDNTVNCSFSSPDTVINSKYAYTNTASVEKIIIAEPGNSPSVNVIQKLTTDSLIFNTTISVTVGTGINSYTVIYPVIYRLARK